MSQSRKTHAAMTVSLALLMGSALAQEYTDVNVQWASENKLFPNSEAGRFYSGEVLSVKAAGRIDRNHDYHEDCHTEWLFVKKCHDVSQPRWVNYADHPLQMVWISTINGVEQSIDRRTVPAGGLTVTVPQADGRIDSVLRIGAFIPGYPVGIERATSYGAYQFSYQVDPKPRLKLLEDYLKSARPAEDLQRPELLNRRLREAEPLAIALMLIEHARKRWTGNTSAQEDLLRLAQNLAPGNRDVSIALSSHYLQTGNFAAAEVQVRERMKSSQALAAAPGASKAQLDASGADAEDMATIYERRGGLVGKQDLAAAEFWYGEAVKAFSRAKSHPRMNTAIGKQANILLRVRTMSALQKATAVLQDAFARLPSSYRSPDRAPVKGVSQDGKFVHFAGPAEPGLLLSGVSQEELSSRLYTGPATLMAVAGSDLVVLNDKDDGGMALNFVPVSGGEIRSVALPAKPDLAVPYGGRAALILSKQGTKQQLWRVQAQGSSKLLEFETGSGWLADFDGIQSLHANNAGAFAAVVERSRTQGAILTYSGTLAIYDHDGKIRAQTEKKVQIDFQAMDIAHDATKMFELYEKSGAGELTDVAIAPGGTHAIAQWKTFVRSQSQWLVLPETGTVIQLQVPTDTALLPAAGDEDDIFLKLLTEAGLDAGRATSPLLSATPKQLPPQGWKHGSFTPDGQRILVSNWVKGVLVFDLKGKLLDRIEIPDWIRSVTPAGTQRVATVIPFGHIWQNPNQIWIGGARAVGKGTEPFLLSVDLAKRKVQELLLSRSAMLQLANWSWREKNIVPSPVLVPSGESLKLVSAPGETHVVHSLPTFEEVGRLTTPYRDTLLEQPPTEGRLVSESGQLVDFKTGTLLAGASWPGYIRESLAIQDAGGLRFLDIVPTGASEQIVLREHATGKILFASSVSLPQKNLRTFRWGDCVVFIDSSDLSWIPANPTRRLTWVRLGGAPASGFIEWKDNPGYVSGMRCAAGSEPAVLLVDSMNSNPGLIGWQKGHTNGIQPPFEPLSGLSVSVGSVVKVRQSSDGSRLLVTTAYDQAQAFVYGAGASGAYQLLEGPLPGDAREVVTDAEISMIGTHSDGRVTLRKVGSPVVRATIPIEYPPDEILSDALLKKRWDTFSIWPIPPEGSSN